jgi:hypothetical protein
MIGFMRILKRLNRYFISFSSEEIVATSAKKGLKQGLFFL